MALLGATCILLAATSTAIAYPPSAFDQYTEQPPGDATGPRNSAAIDGGGGDGSGGGAGATFGGSGGSGTSGSALVEANAGGGSSVDRGSEAGGGAGGEQSQPAHSRDMTLVADTRPTNSLLWIALVSIGVALLARAAMAARRRVGGAAAR